MSGTVVTNVPLREASIRAVVIRADGTRRDLGVVSYYSRNPLKRAAWTVLKFLKENLRW